MTGAKRVSKLSPATEWLAARKTLLRHVKREVARRLGEREPADVAEFTKRYERNLRKPWVASTQAELSEAVQNSDLVYGGDFHALAQAQRTHLRILRSIKKNRSVVLALEAFQISAQTWLDQYTSNEIDLETLRVKSKWDRTWGFPWDHYRPLLELARERGFKLLALNSPARSQAVDLARRERAAAKQIAKSCRRYPDALTYVIFGDLHLSPTHLPLHVNEALGEQRLPKRLRALTIFVNSEKVYFELAKRGLELEVDVVKFSDSSYCVLSTPPWVKWQSYLIFLDQAGTTEISIDLRLDDESEFDSTHQVALLVQLAAADLGLKKHFAKINDLAVYGDDDEMIWKQISKRSDVRERTQGQALLTAKIPFFLPKGGVAYLPKPTINAAASLAGFYLHARLSKRSRALWKFPGDLAASVWIEAVAYFISKLVNHSRRSETLSGLHAKLQGRGQSVEALKLALDFRLSEMARLQSGRTRKLQFQPRQKASSVEASRILGGMLGERLYLAYRSRKLKTQELVNWLKVDPSAKIFPKVYDEIVRTLLKT